MCRKLLCDSSELVRGALSLVGCHGFNRVGSFGGRGVLSVSLVKAVLHALIPGFCLRSSGLISSIKQYLKMKRVWVIGVLFALLAFGE